MNNIRLYSTHCPKCRVVEKKLEQAQIQYDLIDAKENPKVIEELTALGVQQMPVLMVDDAKENDELTFDEVLMVDDKILGFSEIIKWIGAR